MTDDKTIITAGDMPLIARPTPDQREEMGAVQRANLLLRALRCAIYWMHATGRDAAEAGHISLADSVAARLLKVQDELPPVHFSGDWLSLDRLSSDLLHQSECAECDDALPINEALNRIAGVLDEGVEDEIWRPLLAAQRALEQLRRRRAVDQDSIDAVLDAFVMRAHEAE